MWIEWDKAGNVAVYLEDEDLERLNHSQTRGRPTLFYVTYTPDGLVCSPVVRIIRPSAQQLTTRHEKEAEEANT